MTKYPAWQRRQFQKQWGNILAIFISIALIFAILNGLIKTFSLKKYLGESKWDSKSSFVMASGTNPAAVVVYQTEPKRIVIFKLGEDKYYFTGKQQNPLQKLSKAVNENNGQELTKILSLAFRADIKYYLFLKNNDSLNKENINQMFKNFASLGTPLVIVKGMNKSVKETNVTRKDLFKLWWQIKSLSINRVEIVDLSNLSQEIVTADKQKVIGVDEEAFNAKITPYLDNNALINSNYKLDLQNASGNSSVGLLAADFINTVGFHVNDSKYVDEVEDQTKIFVSGKKSYAARSLAKIFDCDIFSRQNEAGDEQITLIIGRDFAKRYYQ